MVIYKCVNVKVDYVQHQPAFTFAFYGKPFFIPRLMSRRIDNSKVVQSSTSIARGHGYKSNA